MLSFTTWPSQSAISYTTRRPRLACSLCFVCCVILAADDLSCGCRCGCRCKMLGASNPTMSCFNDRPQPDLLVLYMVGHSIAPEAACVGTETRNDIDGRLHCRHYYLLLQNPTKLNFGKLALEYIPGAAFEPYFNRIPSHRSQCVQSAPGLSFTLVLLFLCSGGRSLQLWRLNVQL